MDKKSFKADVDAWVRDMNEKLTTADKDTDRGLIVLYAEDLGNGFGGTVSAVGTQKALVEALATFLTDERSRDVCFPAVQIANKQAVADILCDLINEGKDEAETDNDNNKHNN